MRLAEEYERIAEAVADLSAMFSASGREPLRLTHSQERALAWLRIQGRREFTRREYEQAGAVGRSTANDDLRELVRHGVVVPRGAGSSTRYVFSAVLRQRPSGERRGRPGRWNDTLIERELRTFVAGRGRWPSPADFRSAGRGDLYAAASRSGGIARWRRILGL